MERLKLAVNRSAHPVLGSACAPAQFDGVCFKLKFFIQALPPATVVIFPDFHRWFHIYIRQRRLVSPQLHRLSADPRPDRSIQPTLDPHRRRAESRPYCVTGDLVPSQLTV